MDQEAELKSKRGFPYGNTVTWPICRSRVRFADCRYSINPIHPMISYNSIWQAEGSGDLSVYTIVQLSTLLLCWNFIEFYVCCQWTHWIFWNCPNSVVFELSEHDLAICCYHLIFLNFKYFFCLYNITMMEPVSFCEQSVLTFSTENILLKERKKPGELMILCCNSISCFFIHLLKNWFICG